MTAKEVRDTLPPPIPARELREREFAQVLSPDNLLRDRGKEREDIIRRVAYTVAIVATVVVVFTAGWLVGVAQ